MTARQPDLDDLSGEPRSFDLRDYWLIIRRHATLIVVLTVLGAIAAAGYAVHSGHKYAATAQVLVTPPVQGQAASSSGSSAQQLSGQVNMSTEQAVAQSPPVVLRAARLLHVRASVLQAEAGHLTVTVPATTLTTSNVLQITWQGKGPAKAQAGANAFANAYLSYRRQLLGSEINGQIASLSRSLASVQQQLTKLRARLLRTPTSSPLHQSQALKARQLGSAQDAYLSKIASLSLYDDSGGTVMPAALPLSRPA